MELTTKEVLKKYEGRLSRTALHFLRKTKGVRFTLRVENGRVKFYHNPEDIEKFLADREQAKKPVI